MTSTTPQPCQVKVKVTHPRLNPSSSNHQPMGPTRRCKCTWPMSRVFHAFAMACDWAKLCGAALHRAEPPPGRWRERNVYNLGKDQLWKIHPGEYTMIRKIIHWLMIWRFLKSLWHFKADFEQYFYLGRWMKMVSTRLVQMFPMGQLTTNQQQCSNMVASIGETYFLEVLCNQPSV